MTQEEKELQESVDKIWPDYKESPVIGNIIKSKYGDNLSKDTYDKVLTGVSLVGQLIFQAQEGKWSIEDVFTISGKIISDLIKLKDQAK